MENFGIYAALDVHEGTIDVSIADDGLAERFATMGRSRAI
jgi:hypothetical protein